MAYANPNGFQRFMSLVTTGDKEPARSNLYSVLIDIPLVIRQKAPGLAANWREHYEAINYFADNVTVPGRRITTGQVRDVGAMRRFATDTAFGEAQFSFILTKDLYHRTFFERWMNYTATDAENRCTFYDEYTSQIMIQKWEVGSNVKWRGKNKEGKTTETRLNRSTGVWQMYGAFPFDMSSTSLNNGPTDLLKLDVSFYFERYRFDTVADNLGFKQGSNDKIISDFNNVAEILDISSGQVDAVRFGF